MIRPFRGRANLARGSRHCLIVGLLLGWLAACSSGPETPGLSPSPAPPGHTPSFTPSPTFTPAPSPTTTPSPTPSATPGPGLATLMLTPAALALEADLEGAVEAYVRLHDLYPDKAEPLLALAALALRRDEQETALDHLRMAVQVEPDNLNALRQLALLLDQRGEYTELVDVYGQMLALAPDDTNLLVARALAYARLGEAEAAIADLESAQAADPYRQYAWANVVGAAASMRQYRSAVEIASAGLAFYPNSISLLLARGLNQLALGEETAALADFEAVIAQDELNYTAYHWRGRTLMLLGRIEEAIPDLKRAGELGVLAGVTGVNEGYEAMADAAEAIAYSDPQAAFSYLAEQVFRYGSREPLLLGYARIDRRRGNPSLALRRLDSLAADGYIPALYWRAVIYAEQGQNDLAIADLQAYLEARRYGPEAEAAYVLLEELGGSLDES